MTEEKTFRLYLPWGSKAFLLGMLIVFLAVTVFMFVLPFVPTGPEAPPAFIGVFWLLILGWNLFWVLRFPYQIVLGSDGTIEFKAIIRRVRMNASEIVSLKPVNGTIGLMTVKGTKSVRLVHQFDDFHEFVLRLKQLNPSVTVRGC